MHIAVESSGTLPALGFIGQPKVWAECPWGTGQPVEARSLWTVEPSRAKLRRFTIRAELPSRADVAQVVLCGVGVGSSTAGYGHTCTNRAVVSCGADVAGDGIHWCWGGGIATAVVPSSAVGVGLGETRGRAVLARVA